MQNNESDNGSLDYLADDWDSCPVCDHRERECVCPPETDEPTAEQKAEQESVDRLFAAGGVSAYSAVTGPIDKPHDIVTINPDQLISDRAEYSQEASTLGWPPGFWPEKLDLGRSVGNGMLFHQTIADSGSTLYRQQFGVLSVRIFND
jgi:hypothetical protein